MMMMMTKRMMTATKMTKRKMTRTRMKTNKPMRLLLAPQRSLGTGERP